MKQFWHVPVLISWLAMLVRICPCNNIVYTQLSSKPHCKQYFTLAPIELSSLINPLTVGILTQICQYIEMTHSVSVCYTSFSHIIKCIPGICVKPQGLYYCCIQLKMIRLAIWSTIRWWMSNRLYNLCSVRNVLIRIKLILFPSNSK